MPLSREEILAAPDLRRDEVSVPEWGGTVRIREMSLEDRAALYDLMYGKAADDKKVGQRGLDLNLEMIRRSAVDESDAPLFTAADLKKLAKKSDRAVRRLVEAIEAMHQMDADAVEAAEGN
jgi:hypothetical protein